MRLRPPHLASDKDAFLLEQRGNRTKLPHGQEGEGDPVPGPGLSSTSLCGLGKIGNLCKPQLLHVQHEVIIAPIYTCKEPK